MQSDWPWGPVRIDPTIVFTSPGAAAEWSGSFGREQVVERVPDLVDYLRERLAVADAPCRCFSDEVTAALAGLSPGLEAWVQCEQHGWVRRMVGGFGYARVRRWWRR